MSETEKKVRKLVHHYYHVCDINCAKTTLYCLGELLGVTIKTQAIQAASGLYNFGGKDLFGLVGGAIMFMGILFSKKNMEETEISELCKHFSDRFDEKFGALLNSNIENTEEGLKVKEEMTVDAILFDYDFLNNVNCSAAN